MHTTVLATCDEVLGQLTSYQLHLTQIIDIGPGNPAQEIHRDQWAFDFFPFPTGYDVQCSTIWAGDEFTEANGATRIVVGSNHLEDGLEFEIEDSVPAEMAIAATFPKPLQRLMGYQMGAYALRYIDDLRDPLAALDPDNDRYGFDGSGPAGRRSE